MHATQTRPKPVRLQLEHPESSEEELFLASDVDGAVALHVQPRDGLLFLSPTDRRRLAALLAC